MFLFSKHLYNLNGPCKIRKVIFEAIFEATCSLYSKFDGPCSLCSCVMLIAPWTLEAVQFAIAMPWTSDRLPVSSPEASQEIAGSPKLLEALLPSQPEEKLQHRRKFQKIKHYQYQWRERHSEDQRSHKCFQFVTHLHVGTLLCNGGKALLN